MRVCFFGLYDPEYPRNAVLRRGLQAAGVDVVDCRETLQLGDTPSLLPLKRTRSLVSNSLSREIERTFAALPTSRIRPTSSPPSEPGLR